MQGPTESGNAVKIDRAINLEDLRSMAKRRLPRIAFDFADGGVHDEVCISANRASFERYALVPRYLVDVSAPDQSVTLFGKTYASPVGIAPMGVAGLLRPGADLMLAGAAAAAKVPYVMSSASCDSIEAAMKIAPETTWFQVYGTKSPHITNDLVRRATDIGVNALVLTVDAPTLSGRERNIRNGFTRPMKLRPSVIMQGLMRPAWTIGYLRHGGVPLMENWAPYVKDGTPDMVADLYGRETPTPGQTWQVFERVRAMWKGPLLIKGLLHAADALRAAELGADGIILSNHGGRQFDRAPAPIEVLAGIREAVKDRLVIGIDSGIRRGSDVAIAKRLGADFALIGRPALYGAAAAGRAGADKALEIMRRELAHALAQTGCTTFDALAETTILERPLIPWRAARAT